MTEIQNISERIKKINNFISEDKSIILTKSLSALRSIAEKGNISEAKRVIKALNELIHDEIVRLKNNGHVCVCTVLPGECKYCHNLFLKEQNNDEIIKGVCGMQR